MSQRNAVNKPAAQTELAAPTPNTKAHGRTSWVADRPPPTSHEPHQPPEDPTMNAPHLLPRPNDETGRRLRTDLEHDMLNWFIDQFRNAELTPDVACKFMHAYCELRKGDVAVDKVLADLVIAVTKDRARSAAAPQGRRTPGALHDPNTITAPHGPNCPGAPCTRDEFRAMLQNAARTIYGDADGADDPRAPRHAQPKPTDRSPWVDPPRAPATPSTTAVPSRPVTPTESGP